MKYVHCSVFVKKSFARLYFDLCIGHLVEVNIIIIMDKSTNFVFFLLTVCLERMELASPPVQHGKIIFILVKLLINTYLFLKKHQHCMKLSVTC